MAKSREMDRDARITKEVGRLKRLLKAAGSRLKAGEGLIQRAAFLRIELEDLEADINEHGSTEIYQSGPKTPPMTRIRAAAQHYDKMVRAYTTVCTQLLNLLPAQAAAPGEKGALEKILERKRAAPIRRVK